jgi:hypothetical protein
MQYDTPVGRARIANVFLVSYPGNRSDDGLVFAAEHPGELTATACFEAGRTVALNARCFCPVSREQTGRRTQR